MTRRRIFLALAAFPILAGPFPAARAAELDAAAAADAVMRRLEAAGTVLRRDVLAPLHARYADAAQALAAVRPGCDGPGDWRAAYRPVFAAALLAWRRLEAAGFGPAADPATAARVYFWPDQHGTAARQLAAALRARDPALTTVTGLAGRSVGLQSLAALEALLFAEEPSADYEDGRFACGFARAIAGFQAELARAVADAFARDSAPRAATAAGLVGGVGATLDVVIALDLERPLGPKPAAARGERARAWRSGLSVALVLAVLDTVERVVTAPGGIPPVLALSPETAALDAVLRERIAASQAALRAIGAPLRLAVADPAERPRVEAALEELRAVRSLVIERLAPALGLGLGFNAVDGD